MIESSAVTFVRYSGQEQKTIIHESKSDRVVFILFIWDAPFAANGFYVKQTKMDASLKASILRRDYSMIRGEKTNRQKN